MTTARDIITAALEDVGVVGLGQTPLGEDMEFGLIRLNRMIGQFNRRRWLIYHLVEITCISTGNQTYSVGPGGDFNVSRPDRLEDGCFFRRNISNGPDFNIDFNLDLGPATSVGSGQVDYPLTLIEARETYNRIALKGLTTWPSDVFYDASFPNGTLHIYPVPAAGVFELHLLLKDSLQTFATPNTVLAMPVEYEEALEYNLALRFCAKYQLDASKEIAGLARAALSTIRSANSQVPLLRMPRRLTGRGGRYNIYSDRST